MPITHPTQEELSGEMRRLGELKIDETNGAARTMLETLNAALETERGAIGIIRGRVPQLVGHLIPSGVYQVNRADFLRWLEQNLTAL